METISLRCKECGGTIEVDPSKNITFCPYCGSKSIISESDQVKIARIKAEERIEREKEKQKTNRNSDKWLHIVMISFFAFFMLIAIIGSIAGWQYNRKINSLYNGS